MYTRQDEQRLTRGAQRHMWGGLMLAGLTMAMVASCGTPAQDARAAVDVNNAICEALEPSLQNEPAWLKFECATAAVVKDVTGTAVQDAGAKPPAKFTVRVPRAKAQEFAARYCPQGQAK